MIAVGHPGVDSVHSATRYRDQRRSDGVLILQTLIEVIPNALAQPLYRRGDLFVTPGRAPATNHNFTSRHGSMEFLLRQPETSDYGIGSLGHRTRI